MKKSLLYFGIIALSILMTSCEDEPEIFNFSSSKSYSGNTALEIETDEMGQVFSELIIEDMDPIVDFTNEITNTHSVSSNVTDILEVNLNSIDFSLMLPLDFIEEYVSSCKLMVRRSLENGEVEELELANYNYAQNAVTNRLEFEKNPDDVLGVLKIEDQTYYFQFEFSDQIDIDIFMQYKINMDYNYEYTK